MLYAVYCIRAHGWMRRERQRDPSDIWSTTDTGVWWAQSPQAVRAGGLCRVETLESMKYGTASGVGSLGMS